MSDALDEWVDGIRSGSQEAFHAVYEHLADELVSFAHGMLRDRRTAEDVVQQAFVELVRGRLGFRGDGRALRAWLYRSARFGCMDEFRRRRRHPETVIEQVPDQGIDVDPMAEMLDPRVVEALDSLTERQRSMIVLRHVVGLSPTEIAVVFDSARPAVYAALGRAERRLRILLQDSGVRSSVA